MNTNPDYKLLEFFGKSEKELVEYLEKPEKIEKYSINTTASTGYYRIYCYYSKGLNISCSKSGSSPSSMDDVGRSLMNGLRRAAYRVESIKFISSNDFLQCKTILGL